MSYVALVLVWESGFVLGMVAMLCLREYFLRRPESVPEIDAHERSTWPVERR